MTKTVEIEKLAYGGEGIGHVDGKVCFVEGALPGEKVTVQITQDKKKFMRAKLAEILSPSPEREKPPCVFVETCGGCQYQHLTYEAELRSKESQVRDSFIRQLKVPADRIHAIHASPESYGYRNSVTLHRVKSKNKEGLQWGFFGRDNTTIVPIKECLLLDSRLQELFTADYLKDVKLRHPTFRLSEDGRIHSESGDLFKIKVGEHSFFTSPTGFFQNNLAVTSAIVGEVRKWVETVKPKVFLDLYAGMGLFALAAAHDVKQLICVESHPGSLEALLKNEKVLGREIAISDSPVEKVLPDILATLEGGDDTVAMLDPPRQGLDERVRETLTKDTKIGKIAYLSCHLGTMVRDLEQLIQEGKYEIVSVMPFDMFPRTKHIEILVCLDRIKR